MRLKSGRRFTVPDAIILVAASALAFAVIRNLELWPELEPDGKLNSYLVYIHSWFYLFSHLFSAWSLAFLILRLRRPRPNIRRLCRQPGTTACGAATMILGIGFVNFLAVVCVLAIDSRKSLWRSLAIELEEIESSTFDEIRMIPPEIGCAIAAIWTFQALSGYWRPEPSWIDRSGRLIGAFWIAALPFAWFMYIECKGG